MLLKLLAGVQTPNCIRATAFDAVAYDYPFVTVLSDATGAQSDAIHSGSNLPLNHFILKNCALQILTVYHCCFFLLAHA